MATAATLYPGHTKEAFTGADVTGDTKSKGTDSPTTDVIGSTVSVVVDAAGVVAEDAGVKRASTKVADTTGVEPPNRPWNVSLNGSSTSWSVGSRRNRYRSYS